LNELVQQRWQPQMLNAEAAATRVLPESLRDNTLSGAARARNQK